MKLKAHLTCGWLGSLLILFSLTGCNMPGAANQAISTLNVTQAYQTVEARLTQAVAGTPDGTPLPSPTVVPTLWASPSAALQVTPTVAFLLTRTPTPTTSCDQAAPGNPIDVTIPDDSPVLPGQTFTKIWRLQNTGTCTWTKDYSIAVFSGEAMNAPASVPIPGVISPGQTIDIGVDLVAPLEAGTYQGNWKLRNASKAWFGIGPDGNAPFWVRVQVQPLPTGTASQPTPTTTITPAVQTSGAKTLVPGDSLNLDNNQINSVTGDDITYLTDDNQLLLAPDTGVVLGIYGPSQPGLFECQSTSMGSSPVILNNLSPGLYLCYKTNLNLTGWLLIEGFNTNTLALTIQFLTWMTP